MKKTKMLKKGEFIKITERKCGGLQPHVQIGSLYDNPNYTQLIWNM